MASDHRYETIGLERIYWVYDTLGIIKWYKTRLSAFRRLED